MNILFITNQLNIGGAERFVVRLGSELARRGHQITVASEGGSMEQDLPAGIAIPQVHARAKTPRRYLTLIQELVPLLDGIQVVHANSPTTALAARLARGARPIPIVASAHGVWKDAFKPLVSALFSLGADRVVGCSQDLSNDLLKYGLWRSKSRTIRNGIPLPQVGGDRQKIRRSIGLPDEARMLFTVANLLPYKGHRYLMDALPMILRRFPDVYWVLAGNGPLRESLEVQAHRLGVSSRVVFLGDRQDINDLLYAADIFCMPSLSEGLPLAAEEAMAVGLPLVMTKVGGVAELVLDGETGYLVEPQDPYALAQRLGLVLENPELGRRMGELGRARIVEHFSIEGMASQFEALYEELLAYPVPAPAVF